MTPPSMRKSLPVMNAPSGRCASPTSPGVPARNAPSGTQKHFDRPALVHRPVGVGHLFEGQRKVENPSGIDGSVPCQINQLGQISAHGCRAPMQVNVGEEELLPSSSTP